MKRVIVIGCPGSGKTTLTSILLRLLTLRQEKTAFCLPDKGLFFRTKCALGVASHQRQLIFHEKEAPVCKRNFHNLALKKSFK